MKRKSLLLVAVLCVLLVGCSSKFAYNNLDWLLYWYLDDYVELDKSQKKQFDLKLDEWLVWHRQEELSAYKTHLSSLLEKLRQGPLSSEQWLTEFAAGRAHWVRLRDRLSPELAEFAEQLSDEQVEELFVKLEEENQEEEEERKGRSVDEALEKRIDSIQDQMKDWVGRLSKAQKQLATDYAPKFESNFVNWIAYRRHIQQAAKALMEKRKDLPDFADQLHMLISNPEGYQSQAFIDASEHNRRVFAELVAEFNLTLTARQEKRLYKEISDLIEDLDDLIQD